MLVDTVRKDKGLKRVVDVGADRRRERTRRRTASEREVTLRSEMGGQRGPTSSASKERKQDKNKLGVCFDFTKGKCHRGAGCKFSHDMENMQPASTSNGGICFDYIHGQCNRGDACRFSHDLQAISQESREERGICFDFTRGTCTRGELCRFSHNIDVVGFAPGGPAAQEQAQALAKSAGVCFDFMKGICHRGSACRFSHDLSLLQSVEALKKLEGDSGKGLCYDYVRGQCARGRSCKFSHDTSLPEITSGLLSAANQTNGVGDNVVHTPVEGMPGMSEQQAQAPGLVLPESQTGYAAVAAGRYVSPSPLNMSAPSSYSSDGILAGSPNLGYAAVASGKGVGLGRAYAPVHGQASSMAPVGNGNGADRGLAGWGRKQLQPDEGGQYIQGVGSASHSLTNGNGWNAAEMRASHLDFESSYVQLNDLAGGLQTLQLQGGHAPSTQNGLGIHSNGWRGAVGHTEQGECAEGSFGRHPGPLHEEGLHASLSQSPPYQQEGNSFQESAFKWDSLFSGGSASSDSAGLDLGAIGSDRFGAHVGDSGGHTMYGSSTLYGAWSGGYSMG